MRGALVGCQLAVRGGGIIPADAGSTAMYNMRHITTVDHPRGCGEHHPDFGQG